jgi:hypothetical protein
VTKYRPDTWGAKRKFNPGAEVPAELQPKPKRRQRKHGKKAQFMAAIVEELLELRNITDRAAAAVLSHKKPATTPKPALND